MENAHTTVSFSTCEDVEVFVLHEMKRLGLHEWSFQWDHAMKRLGSCQYSKKRITLSINYVKLNLDHSAQILDTVYHELAHAMAWVHGREVRHGKLWKYWCRNLGAVPKACVPINQVRMSRPKYELRLKTTNELVAVYYRLPACRRRLNQMMIRNRPETRGQLVLVKVEHIDNESSSTTIRGKS